MKRILIEVPDEMDVDTLLMDDEIELSAPITFSDGIRLLPAARAIFNALPDGHHLSFEIVAHIVPV